MDPKQTWVEMLDLWRDGNHHEAIFVATDLVDWLNKGGTCPEIFTGDNEIRVRATVKLISGLELK